jgi:hypothetical protein
LEHRSIRSDDSNQQVKLSQWATSLKFDSTGTAGRCLNVGHGHEVCTGANAVCDRVHRSRNGEVRVRSRVVNVPLDAGLKVSMTESGSRRDDHHA